MRDLERLLARVDDWGAEHAVAAVAGPGGVIAVHGDPSRPYHWASVTKPLTALAVLIAADRGLLSLDEPAGPEGSTVRHLLAHASGLPFEGTAGGPAVPAVLASPGTRRIYSNPGYDVLGALVAERAGIPFEDALREWVLAPLGMDGTHLIGRPSEGLHGPLTDLLALAIEALRSGRLPPAVVAAALTLAFPGLPGVVPGVGRFDRCDWGLGFEIHGAKAPHWMGVTNSPATAGHFGGAGTFVWIDPVAGVAVAVLTDRAFGPWALEAWPALSDAILATLPHSP